MTWEQRERVLLALLARVNGNKTSAQTVQQMLSTTRASPPRPAPPLLDHARVGPVHTPARPVLDEATALPAIASAPASMLRPPKTPFVWRLRALGSCCLQARAARVAARVPHGGGATRSLAGR